MIAYIQLSYGAKLFDISSWQGDLQIASLGNLSFPPIPPKKIIKVTWFSPPEDFVKINADGAFSQFSNLAASGGLIRDDTRRILKAYQAFIGNFSVVYSELLAIWLGLRICQRMGLQKIVVETDS